jgi:hypothetical protein
MIHVKRILWGTAMLISIAVCCALFIGIPTAYLLLLVRFPIPTVTLTLAGFAYGLGFEEGTR